MAKTVRDERFSKGRSTKKNDMTLDVLPGTRIDDYLAPWLIGLLLVPGAGFLAHKFWGTGWWAWVFPPLIIVAGVVVAFLVHEDVGARRRLVQIRVYASIGAVFTAVAVSAWFGPFVRPWIDIQVIGTVVLCGAWTVAAMRAVRGEGTDDHTQEAQDVLATLGVKGTPVSSAGGKDVYKLTHRNVTRKNLQHLIPEIALALNARFVRILKTDKDRPQESILEVMVDGPALEIRDWPGPSRPGGSIAEPCRVGTRASGKDLEILRPGDPKVARSAQPLILSAGMMGAGKTMLTLNETAEIISRRDAVLWWVDTRKWQAVRRQIGPAVDWVATEIPDARVMLKALMDAVDYRCALFAELGYTEWVPELWTKHGVPYVIIQIEEAGGCIDELEDEIKEAIETIRSSGISITISQQRQSGENISTGIRDLAGMRMCCGVGSDRDAKFVLSDSTMAAGINPGEWRSSMPGCCVIEASHIPEEEWSDPGRTFRIMPDVMERHVAEWAPRMATLDEGTARAMGDAYAERQRGTDTTSSAHVHTEEDNDMTELLRDVPDEDARTALEYDRETAARIDLSDTDQAAPAIDRDAVFAEVLEELLGERLVVQVSTDDLTTRLYSRGWPATARPSVYTRVRALMADGHMVRQGRGHYELHRSALTSARP